MLDIENHSASVSCSNEIARKSSDPDLHGANKITLKGLFDSMHKSLFLKDTDDASEFSVESNLMDVKLSERIEMASKLALVLKDQQTKLTPFDTLL